MDEIKLAQQQAQGARAQALLNDELLIECFETLKKEYIDYWKVSHVNDEKGRERLWMAVNIVEKVKDQLGKIAAGGRLATKDLSSIKTMKR